MAAVSLNSNNNKMVSFSIYHSEKILVRITTGSLLIEFIILPKNLIRHLVTKIRTVIFDFINSIYAFHNRKLIIEISSIFEKQNKFLVGDSASLFCSVGLGV